MRFLIEIAASDQPGLIRALDRARARLIEGGCYLNICGQDEVKLSPVNNWTEREFRAQYDAAHPDAKWTTGEPGLRK